MTKCNGERMLSEIAGYVHSMETLGTLDGPGIRMIVFMQGCRLRCQFCHNADTWAFPSKEELEDNVLSQGAGGQKYRRMTSDEILRKVLRYKPYFKTGTSYVPINGKNEDKHNCMTFEFSGGITFSGGEPLMQPEFLLECLKKCKAAAINTTIDTAGVGKGNYDEILKYADIVILDIKHANAERYKFITGMDIKHYREFKEAAIRNKSNLWLKHVVTPGINDTEEDIRMFQKEVDSFPKNMVKKVELLPYHTLGNFKYESMGLKYRLDAVKPMNLTELAELKFFLDIPSLI